MVSLYPKYSIESEYFSLKILLIVKNESNSISVVSIFDLLNSSFSGSELTIFLIFLSKSVFNTDLKAECM